MKKIISWVITIAMLLSVMPMAAFAAWGTDDKPVATLSVEGVDGANPSALIPGAQVKVTMTISGLNKDWNGFSAQLNYDSDKFELASAFVPKNNCAALVGLFGKITPNLNVAGRIIIAAATTSFDADYTDYTEYLLDGSDSEFKDIDVITLTFVVKESAAPGNAEFSVATSNAGGATPYRLAFTDASGYEAVTTSTDDLKESVTVVETNSLAISGGAASIAAPLADSEGNPGSTDTAFAATVIGSDGSVVENPSVAWTVSPVDAGVSVNNGVVTVKSNATAGEYTLTATAAASANEALSADASASVTFTVTKETAVVTRVVTGGGQGTIAVPDKTTAENTTSAFTATVYDQYGAVMSGQSVSWSLDKTYTGVTINQTSGVVTVTNKASAGTVTVTAACNGKTGTADLTITKASSVATTVQIGGGQKSIGVPTAVVGRASTEAFTATVYDQYGAEMSGQEIAWSVTTATGVSIENGVVTVTNKAAGGTVTVTAACNGKTGTADLTITKADPVATSMKVLSGGSEVSDTDVIGIPGSKEYTAVVYDQYGDVMTGESATLTLSNTEGFSIENGEVTVAGTTANDATATLTASYGDLPSIEITITAKQVAVDWNGITLNDPATITYGDSKASAFKDLPATGTAKAYVDGKETKIDGTFAIKDADEILGAGEQSVVVVFTVTSDGTYKDNKFEKTYLVTVQPKPVAVEWSNTTLTYNGTVQQPAAEVTKGLVGSDELTVTVTGGQKNAGKDITATASINNGNYTLTNSRTTYTIAPKPVTVKDGTYAVSKVYDGNTNATATGALGLDEVLTEDTVTVSGTIGAYADKNVDSSKTVTVSDLTLGGADAGNYTLGNVTSYEFTKATITPATVTVSGITAADKTYNAATDASLVYTGAVLAGKIDGDSLSVTATGAFADKNVGSSKPVTISGLALTGTDAGNYVLAVSGNQSTTTAAIKPYTLTVEDGTVSVTKVYDTNTNAGTLTGALTLRGVFAGDIVSVNMDKVTAGEYSNSTVGTYTVTLTLGSGVLTGADAGNYTVASSYNFSGAKITKQIQAPLTITGAENKTFGDADFTITVTGGNGEGAYSLTSSDPSVLKLTAGEENGQWTAEILKVGAVTLTANRAGDDNYEPATAATATVTVNAKTITDSDFTFDLDNKTYTGAEIKPSVVSDLTAGTDYKVEYSSNVNVGQQATITVTGQGNYTGTVTKTFQIVPKSIAGVTISGVEASYTYTGSAITPTVTVTDGSAVLTLDKDYTVAYTNNTTRGTATITVTGQGNYTGTATKTFEIVAAPASGTVTISGTGSGEGGAYQPGDALTASVTNGSVDQLSYQWYNKGAAIEGATNNTYTLKVGDTSVYVVVTSSGNYVGTLKSKTIEVGKIPLPGTVSVSVTDGDENTAVNGVGDTVVITVDPSLSTNDYTVVWMRNGDVIPGASSTSYPIAKEDQGKTISVKIVAKGDVYTGEKAAEQTVSVAAVKPDAPVLSASAGNQKVTLTWAAPYDGGSAITGYVLTVTPAEGEPASYKLAADVTSYEVAELTNGTEYTFVLTAVNAIGSSGEGVVKATPKAPSGGSGGGIAVATYTLTFDTNGGSAVAKISKTSGTTIDLSKYTSTKDGYTFDGWYSDKALTNPVTSVKLDKNLTVYAKWTEQSAASDLPFVDVKPNDWFHDAVAYVYEEGIMNGTSATAFSPNVSTTRGMIVTMLYRMEDEPDAKTENVFSDVAADQYYADPVTWAAANGIVNGTSETTFAPNQAITREQLAAILYRYAQYKNADVSASADLSAFADAGSVSSYAVSAMQWAVGAGIVNGRDENLLAPAGTATRAEVATMIMRFVENVL